MADKTNLDRVISRIPISPRTQTGDQEKGLVGAVSAESAVVSPLAPQAGTAETAETDGSSPKK